MDVECKVAIYEINGDEENTKDAELLVTSHGCINTRINLRFGNGYEITVEAADLRKAIDNAVNS